MKPSGPLGLRAFCLHQVPREEGTLKKSNKTTNTSKRRGTPRVSPPLEEDYSSGPTAQRIAQRLRARRQSVNTPPAENQETDEAKRLNAIMMLIARTQMNWEKAGTLDFRGAVAPEATVRRGKPKESSKSDGDGLSSVQQHLMNPAVWPFLLSLKKKGISPFIVENILKGKVAQNTDATELYAEWVRLSRNVKPLTIRRRDLLKLKRSYSTLNWRITNDQALLPAFKSQWRLQYKIIQAAIADLELSNHERTNSNSPQLNVGVNKNLSRQSFWTPLVRALVTYWIQVGQTQYQAFKHIAEIFSLAFPPFPNDSDLIKRRYYHARKLSSR